MKRTVLCAAFLAAAAMLSNFAPAQTLNTLVDFTYDNGAYPMAGLIADANGNLFGTTPYGGADGYGNVFEIVKTNGVYASTPAILVSFDGNNGNTPMAGLIMDANGNLFGTTSQGGPSGNGNVFEIVKTNGVYANSPTDLFDFDWNIYGGDPESGLIMDANGDLFGTTAGGGRTQGGTVFEIVKTNGAYASTPIVLANFDVSDGAVPQGNLMMDANGNLFGTTQNGGAYGVALGGFGTVFEIPKTNGVYASTPTVLVNFDGNTGGNPYGGVIMDANGNLFGTTTCGGAYTCLNTPFGSSSGTVFEVVKTNGVYASTPTFLVNFAGANTAGEPEAGLIMDTNGNLFGTTASGGADYVVGTVFEVVKTNGVYASTPTIVIDFSGYDGASPEAGLIADADGNLFGTTFLGNYNGTVFEVTNSGFAPYQFSGFLAPVKNAPTVNTGKAGKTYPVKWQLTSSDGAYVSALSAIKSITYSSVPCGNFTGDSADALETTTAGNSSLRYDSTANQYAYNWATPATAGCYDLYLTLDSGQVYPAYFMLN